MAEKAGRKEKNPEDSRTKRLAKGTRTSRRQGTKTRLARAAERLRWKSGF